ncbi:MAG: hypothetical protein LBH40_06175 [Alphaproteobacteria bacterium]|jgi:endonuclease YncB( thermonuclease family)|nr:hypothetical protein [Alphaproteobacteria bacterium]
MKVFSIIIISIFLVANLQANIKYFQTKITYIFDGDTIQISNKQRVRLACIDAFEVSYGNRAAKQAKKFRLSQSQVVAKG